MSPLILLLVCLIFFFLLIKPSTVLYTLSLHDALPILRGDGQILQRHVPGSLVDAPAEHINGLELRFLRADRKSTRLNSSHTVISYAVFCLKKKMEWLIFLMVLIKLLPILGTISGQQVK